MKTLAQAKRDFTVGKKIEIIENNFKPERVGAIGIITKVFTNKFEYLDSMTGKAFTYWWKNTKENIYQGDILTVINKYNNNSVAFKYKLLK